MGLVEYYQSLCPFELLVDFFTLQGRHSLKKVEMALCFGLDVFKRYQRFDSRVQLDEFCLNHDVSAPLDRDVTKLPLFFENAQDWRKTCIANQPSTVHVGAIYPGLDLKYERRNHDLQKYRPLVFDADMEDFLKAGHQRTCACDPKTICDDCFKAILRPAMKCLQQFLQDMGFKAIVFVYSGRRGFHCYVLDEPVWSWTNAQRSDFLARVPSQVALDTKVTRDTLHLLKAPFFPHQSTGIIACPIVDLNGFLPSTHTKHYKSVDRGDIDQWGSFVKQQLRYAFLAWE